MSFYYEKKILVTGGTGLIGRPLVDKLVNLNAKVKVVSLDSPIDHNIKVEYVTSDLRDFNSCLDITKNCDIVFHLAGVKGSPLMTKKKPSSFFVPTITFNTNIMEASRRNSVKNFLYTSSIGVYSPAEIFKEDDVWKTFPSENDRFAGWAKRMGELQAESYNIEYGWKNISIVRPANVFGKYDNFNPSNAMVIPSLIHRIISGENPLKVWGDGSQIRDFIFANDVAEGMLKVVELGINNPVNLGSGKKISIKEIVDILVSIKSDLKVEWDISKPSGDKIRLMDTSYAESLGISSKTLIADAIKETYDWYNLNYKKDLGKYNSFEEIN